MAETPTELIRVKKEIYDIIRWLADNEVRSIGGQVEVIVREWLELKNKPEPEREAS